jgi:hypothetical protein
MTVNHAERQDHAYWRGLLVTVGGQKNWGLRLNKGTAPV